MKLPCLLVLWLVVASALPAAEVKRTEDLIYGRKFGTALTMDVFEPAQKNGAGVVWMVSGGFFSSKEAINQKFYQPLLDRGYVVFAVVHGSQPRYTIPEIIEDVQRAARYIHRHARKYGVEPARLGVSGGSAGGHLSLTLGTRGGPGKPAAKDPLDRESSAVAAVACFFPPTDFLNWGAPGDDAVGVGTLKQFKPAFGPRSDTPEGRKALSREISPIHYIRSNLPPTLIIHGDADKLVPIYQAQIFERQARQLGNHVKVLVKPGADHGWAGMDKDVAVIAEWFDEHLPGRKP